MSRGQSPDTSFQLDEGTALQRLQNGLELGLSISKPTASARSAEILEAINKMELTFPMLTSEGAEDRVERLVNTILQAVGDLPVGRRKSQGWLKESLIPLCTNCIQKGYLTFVAEQMERIQAEAQNFREATNALQEREEAAALQLEMERAAMNNKLEEASKRQAEGDVRQSRLLGQMQEYKKRIGEAAQIVRAPSPSSRRRGCTTSLSAWL